MAKQWSKPPEMQIDPKKKYKAHMDTDKGTMVIELFADKAPKTVNNFVFLAREGFYEGVMFHRVISNFMIQGGGFTTQMSQKPTREPIENEADNGLKNSLGSIAMARTSDPHSATAQFFINATDRNDFLNHSSKTPNGWGYCVFGKVIEGLDVVDKIRGVKTGSRGMHQDVPTATVVIVSARRA